MKPWPADSVERRPLDDLLPYVSNARVHPEWQIAQIARSIEEWGWTIPILIDEDGNVIAGHGRILAAMKLGIADAPCMTAKGWSEDQKKAYVIADNKLALNAIWDQEMLQAELKSLADFDTSLIGFGEAELSTLLNGWSWEAKPTERDETENGTVILKVRCPEEDAPRITELIEALFASHNIDLKVAQ